MAAQTDVPLHESPPADSKRFSGIFKKLMSWKHSAPPSPELEAQEADEKLEKASRPASPSKDLMRRVSRKVVPGLPRAKTFKRQQSEGRDKLEPIAPTQAERRAVSVDRRANRPRSASHTGQQQQLQLPRASAPDFLDDTYSVTTAGQTLSVPHSPIGEKHFLDAKSVSTIDIDHPEERDLLRPGTPLGIHSRDPSTAGARSTTTSLYDAQIHDELESKWILNLSMHFRDKSKREKFFVTFRQQDFLWRRVTISLDYRNAPEDSLEQDLLDTKFQREKSEKIYKAIRESLHDIQFYDTVTNLKLQTTDARLHVHVVEDVNEIIHYPTVRMIQHLRCRRIRERHLDFDSHMSGFVYKVRVGEKTLIKKEIPGPDTVDEFLYEVNALNALSFSSSVIKFYGVVVDDNDENVKGLLIDYAGKGALIDLIYDSQEHGVDLPWATRELWARQIVQGLADIHEAGFVQGDFTLSNIVIDDESNAKIIDINRRGCPVGWEPPEATPLIDSNQRISMYIGVKSDLYQLGMVLWALATLEDEPEAHQRPLRLDPEIEVPRWYRNMVENCLSDNPRLRLQASTLVTMFPESQLYDDGLNSPQIRVEDGFSVQDYMVESYDQYGRQVRAVTPRHDWSYFGAGSHSRADSPGLSDDSYYPPRGRSPPSPLPSNSGCDSPYARRNMSWFGDNTVPRTRSVSSHERCTPKSKDPEITEELTMSDKMEDDLRAMIRTDVPHDDEGTSDANTELSRMLMQGAPAPPEIVVDDTEDRSNPATETKGQLPQTQSASVREPVETGEPAATKETTKPHISGIAGREPDTAQQSPAHDQGDAPDLSETPRTAGESSGNKSPPSKRIPKGQAYEMREYSEMDSGPSYTYDRAGSTEGRLGGNTRQNSTQPKMPSELTGIGSGHIVHDDEFRQNICSDEDLGLSSPTATQNVTSQA